MSRTASKVAPMLVADDYMDLVRGFPLRPIRTVRQYEEATAVLDRLVVREKLTPGERDYTEALTTFVAEYDDAHRSARPERVSPLEMLRALMEHAGMNTVELGRLLGSKGVASEILNGRRPLSKAHIFKLADRFNIEPGVLLERPKVR